MNESIERFGPDAALTGILSGPAGSGAPLLVLPSAGLVPRAGPFRLHVEIAQRLAPRGVRTFRFDVPGVAEAPFLAGLDALGATRAAIDHVIARGHARRVVVGGICSAADRGWFVAQGDARVAGVLMLDGFALAGPWFHQARIAGVLARPPREWLRVAGRRAGSLAGAETELVSSQFRDWPANRGEARAQLAALLARDARLLMIYTGGVPDYLRDVRQLRWTFGPALDDVRVQWRYWADCDHTFYARFARERLLDTLEAWFAAAFGGSVP